MRVKLHQPRHIYLNSTVYFITASIYRKANYLALERKKSYLLAKIREVLVKFGYRLYAWVILNNHYHILFKSRRGEDLRRVIGSIHGSSSRCFNELDNKQGRRIWQSYWDKCICDKDDFYRHFNYIHHNPVKHGYVAQMEDYPFSSFKYWLERKGVKWGYSVFEEYPILDYTREEDCFINP